MVIWAWCCARIYGWRFATSVPVRAIWGNWINGLATVTAYYRYFSAVMHGRPLVWLKTEHAYQIAPHGWTKSANWAKCWWGARRLALKILQRRSPPNPPVCAWGTF